MSIVSPPINQMFLNYRERSNIESDCPWPSRLGQIFLLLSLPSIRYADMTGDMTVFIASTKHEALIFFFYFKFPARPVSSS